MLRLELQEAFHRDGGLGEAELSIVGVGFDGIEDAVAEVLVDEAEANFLRAALTDAI